MSAARQAGKPQSRGYHHARVQAAKLHQKAARQNTHAARVWARRVVDDHQVIAVEDFRPLFLAKSTLARKAADAAIGAAKRELIERPAGGPEGGAGPARLHHDDLRGVRNERQGTPRAG